MTPRDFALEATPEGPTLVVTGDWSKEAEASLLRGEANGLVLNYARGFREKNLDFLDGSWKVRRLDVLARGVVDLNPIHRLGDSLHTLSVQAASDAELDLSGLPSLRSLAAEWYLIRRSLRTADDLTSVTTWRFDESDLRAFRNHFRLEHLTIKEAPQLRSLSGVNELLALESLGVLLARRLADISDVADLDQSLRELEFEDCPGISGLDDLRGLVNLQFLGISECADIPSLHPIRSLTALEVLYAWGTTRIVDGDLSPIAELPRLRELRMRDRRHYTPHVSELQGAVG